MKPPSLHCDKLAVGYHGRAVLSDLSFTFASGSFTAILGGNGSGKTTLLKTLLGLLPPVAGSVRADGPVRFGYVPQVLHGDPLYPLTAFEVALMGTCGQVAPGCRIPAEERQHVLRCLAEVAADGFARQEFSELSGGQRQRVLIARALAARPNLLVLDEPTSGIDSATAKAVMELVSKLHQELGLSIILVSHDLEVIRRHAGHLLRLGQGQARGGALDRRLAGDILEAWPETEGR